MAQSHDYGQDNSIWLVRLQQIIDSIELGDKERWRDIIAKKFDENVGDNWLALHPKSIIKEISTLEVGTKPEHEKVKAACLVYFLKDNAQQPKKVGAAQPGAGAGAEGERRASSQNTKRIMEAFMSARLPGVDVENPTEFAAKLAQKAIEQSDSEKRHVREGREFIDIALLRSKLLTTGDKWWYKSVTAICQKELDCIIRNYPDITEIEDKIFANPDNLNAELMYLFTDLSKENRNVQLKDTKRNYFYIVVRATNLAYWAYYKVNYATYLSDAIEKEQAIEKATTLVAKHDIRNIQASIDKLLNEARKDLEKSALLIGALKTTIFSDPDKTEQELNAVWINTLSGMVHSCAKIGPITAQQIQRLSAYRVKRICHYHTKSDVVSPDAIVSDAQPNSAYPKNALMMNKERIVDIQTRKFYLELLEEMSRTMAIDMMQLNALASFYIRRGDLVMNRDKFVELLSDFNSLAKENDNFKVIFKNIEEQIEQDRPMPNGAESFDHLQHMQHILNDITSLVDIFPTMSKDLQKKFPKANYYMDTNYDQKPPIMERTVVVQWDSDVLALSSVRSYQTLKEQFSEMDELRQQTEKAFRIAEESREREYRKLSQEIESLEAPGQDAKAAEAFDDLLKDTALKRDDKANVKEEKSKKKKQVLSKNKKNTKQAQVEEEDPLVKRRRLLEERRKKYDEATLGPRANADLPITDYERDYIAAFRRINVAKYNKQHVVEIYEILNHVCGASIANQDNVTAAKALYGISGMYYVHAVKLLRGFPHRLQIRHLSQDNLTSNLDEAREFLKEALKAEAKAIELINHRTVSKEVRGEILPFLRHTPTFAFLKKVNDYVTERDDRNRKIFKSLLRQHLIELKYTASEWQEKSSKEKFATLNSGNAKLRFALREARKGYNKAVGEHEAKNVAEAPSGAEAERSAVLPQTEASAGAAQAIKSTALPERILGHRYAHLPEARTGGRLTSLMPVRSADDEFIDYGNVNRKSGARSWRERVSKVAEPATPAMAAKQGSLQEVKQQTSPAKSSDERSQTGAGLAAIAAAQSVAAPEVVREFKQQQVSPTASAVGNPEAGANPASARVEVAEPVPVGTVKESEYQEGSCQYIIQQRKEAAIELSEIFGRYFTGDGVSTGIGMVLDGLGCLKFTGTVTQQQRDYIHDIIILEAGEEIPWLRAENNPERKHVSENDYTSHAEIIINPIEVLQTILQRSKSAQELVGLTPRDFYPHFRTKDNGCQNR